jgi:hypothetical protein
MKLSAHQKGADRMSPLRGTLPGGMRVEQATGKPYESFIFALEELTRPEADTLSHTHKGPPSRQSHSNQGEKYGKNR